MSDNVIFFVILTCMVVLAIGILWPALRGIVFPVAEVRNDDDHEKELRRILCTELDRLNDARATGEISPEEFQSEKLDLQRRALDECNTQEIGTVGRAPTTKQNRLMATAVIVLVGVLSFGIYFHFGVPEIIGILEKSDKVETVEGIRAMEAYVNSNPLDGRAWILMARTYVEEGRYEQAAHAYREGRKVQSNIREDVEVMLELGATLLSIGDPVSFREAQDVITKAWEKEPSNPKVNQLLIMAAAANHDWETGARELRILLQSMAPDTPEYLQLSQTLKMFEQRAHRSQ